MKFFQGDRCNATLGGPRYIHLTKETNAVFPGFFDPLAPAAIIYNSITSVMNYPVLISSDFSDFTSQVTLERYPSSWFYIRRRVHYPARLQKICLFYYMHSETVRQPFPGLSLHNSF